MDLRYMVPEPGHFKLIIMTGQIFASSAIAALVLVCIFWIRRRLIPEIDVPLQRSSLREALARIQTEKITDVTVTKEAQYPSDWWTSDEILDVERRAIFAKVFSFPSITLSLQLTILQMPVAVGHASEFPKTGSYRVYDHPSGYPIFLVLGKDSVLRGFHNVCRHRAYPVVSTKRSGCTPMLSCRYHGWSYDLRGDLVKAPKFDSLSAFDKSENSLFEISVRVDFNGIIFVNVGTAPEPSAPVDIVKFAKYREEFWEAKVDFNWKLAGKCSPLHCPDIHS